MFKINRTCRSKEREEENYKAKIADIKKFITKEYNSSDHNKKCVIFADLFVFLRNNDTDGFFKEFGDNKKISKSKTLDSLVQLVFEDIFDDEDSKFSDEQLAELYMIIFSVKNVKLPSKKPTLGELICLSKGKMA